MAHPTIAALPAFPVRGEDQTTFATKANATVAAYPTLVTETNALADWVEDTADDVAADLVATGVIRDDTEVIKDQAEDAMTQAIAVAGTYTEIHQGAHATAPTLRNDGTALQNGDLYYNTATRKIQIWS